MQITISKTNETKEINIHNIYVVVNAYGLRLIRPLSSWEIAYDRHNAIYDDETEAKETLYIKSLTLNDLKKAQRGSTESNKAGSVSVYEPYKKDYAGIMTYDLYIKECDLKTVKTTVRTEETYEGTYTYHDYELQTVGACKIAHSTNAAIILKASDKWTENYHDLKRISDLIADLEKYGNNDKQKRIEKLKERIADGYEYIAFEYRNENLPERFTLPTIHTFEDNDRVRKAKKIANKIDKLLKAHKISYREIMSLEDAGYTLNITKRREAK